MIHYKPNLIMLSKEKRRKEVTGRDVPPQACAFCYLAINDDFRFGEFLHEGDMSCHNFCLLFASGLSQSGEDHEGMNGFMLNHIKEELQRGSKLHCSYCKKKGATIGCSIRKCKKKYHFNCGCNNQVLFQFFGNFKSYCKAHKPCQNGSAVTENKTCCRICFELISAEDDCLFCTTCRGDWFHRICLQVYALKAGTYHFKCPLCNNKEEFSQVALTNGIHIPERDAAWELEDNAYHELYNFQECSATTCICPKGRKFQEGSMWSLITCCTCGSNSKHKICENIKASLAEYICEDCKEIESRVTTKTSIPTKNDIKDSTVAACSSSCSIAFSDGFDLKSEKLNWQPIVVLQRLRINGNFQSVAHPRNNAASKGCFSHGKCLKNFFRGNGECTQHCMGKFHNITNMPIIPDTCAGYKKQKSLKSHKSKLSRQNYCSKDLNMVKIEHFFKIMPHA